MEANQQKWKTITRTRKIPRKLSMVRRRSSKILDKFPTKKLVTEKIDSEQLTALEKIYSRARHIFNSYSLATNMIRKRKLIRLREVFAGHICPIRGKRKNKLSLMRITLYKAIYVNWDCYCNYFRKTFVTNVRIL